MIDGDPILNIISQIISTVLIYIILKKSPIVWKWWQFIVGSILVGEAVNCLSNVTAAFVLPALPTNMIVMTIACAVMQFLIGWPIFALLRSGGKFLGAATGFACALAYTALSIIYAIISRFVLGFILG